MAIDSPSAPPLPPGGEDVLETRKRLAAEEAAGLVKDGMKVGLGTGSTVAHLLPALAKRQLKNVRCAVTSVATEQLAGKLGLVVMTIEDLGGRLDIAIDGADQVDPDGWLIKGGGAAHTREKIVAAAAERFVVIAGEEKLVKRLRPPVPLELLRFGLAATLLALSPTRLRDVPESPDGNVIADYEGEIEDPESLATRLAGTPGVVEHGLFEPTLVSEIIVGGDHGVRRIAGGKPSS